jgi:hypothetical protein
METGRQCDDHKENCEHGFIENLATERELGIEEIDRKKSRYLPEEPARPVTDVPLTGMSVSPFDGVVVVEMDVPGAGENGEKATNRFQRKGL